MLASRDIRHKLMHAALVHRDSGVSSKPSPQKENLAWGNNKVTSLSRAQEIIREGRLACCFGCFLFRRTAPSSVSPSKHEIDCAGETVFDSILVLLWGSRELTTARTFVMFRLYVSPEKKPV